MGFYFIKTVINNLCRPVKIYDDEELSIVEFVQRALMIHEIAANEITESQFDIFDSDHMHITDMEMLKQWKSDSSFKVTIDLQIERKNIALVAESLEAYIFQQNGDNIFDEQKTLGHLTSKTRQHLIKLIVAFISKQYKGKETQANITIVSRATISLFSCLKAVNSTIDGIDLLYDTQNRSGYLYNALKNVKKKRKAKERFGVLNEEEQLTEEQENNLLKFFKRCVLPKDLKEVEAKMKTTKTQRRSIILEKIDKYKECWQFYFVSPELILLDFRLMFENFKDAGFIDMWPKLKDKAFVKFSIRIDKQKYEIARKDDDIFKFLTFLKLIPSPHCSFHKSVTKLLVFSDDPQADPIHLRDKKMDYPYIIAIFSVITKEGRYYIDIQDAMICLPPTFTFIQVVDIFIKLHHVFNFEYSKDFAKVLHFFEYTTYDIKSSERFLTPRIKEIMNIIFDEKDENHNNT